MNNLNKSTKVASNQTKLNKAVRTKSTLHLEVQD